MSKDDSTGKIQWDRLVKKLSPYTVQKGPEIPETLRTERILDQAS